MPTSCHFAREYSQLDLAIIYRMEFYELTKGYWMKNYKTQLLSSDDIRL